MEDQIESNKTQKTKAVERVTIEESLRGKLSSLTLQANESLQGMASVTKSDVINFILSSHSGAFTRIEIKSLKGRHFDELKFAQWMAAQLKGAQSKGEVITLRDLLGKNLGLLEGAKPTPPTSKRIRRAKGAQENTEENIETPKV